MQFKYKPLSRAGVISLHLGLLGASAGEGIAQGENDVLDNNPHAYKYRHPGQDSVWWHKATAAPVLNSQSWLRQNILAGFNTDRWHQNQMVANLCRASQWGIMIVLQVNTLRRRHHYSAWQSLALVTEAQATRLLAKRLTLEYYNVFK